MKESMPATAILSVRVSEDEKALLQSAADQTRATVSEFMRRKALEAAEEELLERRVVIIPDEMWASFEARLAEPAREIPAVSELINRTPAWER